MESSLRGDIKALPGAAWILFAGTFVNRFGGFVVVFLVLYLTQRGYSAPQVGVVVSMYGVGAVGASIIGGYLADRLGRRNTIALSMFSAGAVMLGLSQANSLWLISLLTCAAGFTAELYRPASAAYLTDISKAGSRVTIFALYRLAINLGFAAGPAVGGLIAEKSFFVLFVLDAATCVAFGVIALVALPPTHHPSHDGEHSFHRLVQPFRDIPFLIFLLGSLGGAVVFFQFTGSYALQIKAYGFSNTVYGLLISLNGLLVMLFELPLTVLTRRFAPGPVMALGLLLIGIGFGLTALVSTIPLLVVTIAIWTLGEIVFAPVATAYVADWAPAMMRGRYMGAWGLFWGLGHVLGPLIGMPLFHWNPAVLWGGAFITCAFSAIMLLAASTRHRA